MKRNIKMMITVFAVCAVSAMAMMFTGCSVTDKIKQKIDQARCEHEWNDGEVTKEATCTELGELTKTCTLCEKTEKEGIEKIDHVAVYVDAVLSTCVDNGIASGTVCSVCEQKIAGFEEIPALGHVVVKDKAVAPTCLESGLSEGSHCSRCDEVLVVQAVVPATGHNPIVLEAVEPTCTTEGKTQGVKCTNCLEFFVAQEVVSKLDHVLDENNSCTVCGKLDAQFILQKYANSEAVTEVDAATNSTISRGTVLRVHRPDSGYTYFSLTCGDESLRFEIYNDEESASDRYFLCYENQYDLIIDGEFSYIDYGEYVDFYFGNCTISFKYDSSYVGTDENGNPMNVTEVISKTFVFADFYNLSHFGDVSYKILSLK